MPFFGGFGQYKFIGSNADGDNGAAFADITSGAYNIALGSDNLPLVTTGSNNIAAGAFNLASIETGSNNIALGNTNGEFLTGSNNFIVGVNVLGAAVNSSDNIAIGSLAMNAFDGGSYNVVLGVNALRFGSGNSNVAIGREALGAGSGANENNVLVGYQAGYEITDTVQSVIIGYNSVGDVAATLEFAVAIGANSNTCNSGVAIGSSATYAIAATEEGHIAIGAQAGLNFNARGDNFGLPNTYIGYVAAQQDTDGYSNVVVGSYAANSNTGEMSENVIIGAGSGNGNGMSRITVVGYRALANDDTGELVGGGTQSVFIGDDAGAEVGPVINGENTIAFTNTICIGSAAGLSDALEITAVRAVTNTIIIGGYENLPDQDVTNSIYINGPFGSGLNEIVIGDNTHTSIIIGGIDFSGGPGGGGAPVLIGLQTLATKASQSFVFPAAPAKFKVFFNAVSGSGGGTAPIQLRLGDAGGDETAGYLGSVSQSNSTSANLSFAAQTGICVDTAAGAGGQVYYGWVEFEIMDAATNLWAFNGILSQPAFTMQISGVKALSGPITQVTLVAPGTTFDGGTANVSYIEA